MSFSKAVLLFWSEVVYTKQIWFTKLWHVCTTAQNAHWEPGAWCSHGLSWFRLGGLELDVSVCWLTCQLSFYSQVIFLSPSALVIPEIGGESLVSSTHYSGQWMRNIEYGARLCSPSLKSLKETHAQNHTRSTLYITKAIGLRGKKCMLLWVSIAELRSDLGADWPEEWIITWNRRKTGKLGSKRKYFKSLGQRKSMSKGPWLLGSSIQELQRWVRVCHGQK